MGLPYLHHTPSNCSLKLNTSNISSISMLLSHRCKRSSIIRSIWQYSFLERFSPTAVNSCTQSRGKRRQMSLTTAPSTMNRSLRLDVGCSVGAGQVSLRSIFHPSFSNFIPSFHTISPHDTRQDWMNAIHCTRIRRTTYTRSMISPTQ